MKDSPRRFQLILGPRRVGKTTAMYQTVRHLLGEGISADHLWWLRLDHPVLMQLSLDEVVRGALEGSGESGPLYLFMDELVYARNWDLWLKTFYDQRYPVRVIGTSSATAALRDRRLESGVGRWEEQLLMPYLLPEFLNLRGRSIPLPLGSSLDASLEAVTHDRPRVGDLSRHLQELSLVGGFPELLLRPGWEEEASATELESRLLESQRILRSDAIERAVYKDIPQSFGVDNPMALERLLYVLAGQVGGILSPTAIGGELGIAQPTLDRYISYLIHAFLVFSLPNYSGSERSVQRRGRKLYFVDVAVRNAALQRGLAPLRDRAERGVMLENLVASHLHGLAAQTQARLYHWREGSTEVDLVYDDPEAPVAIEVASSADHSRRGLQALVARHPRFSGKCYIVAPRVRMLSPSEAPDGIGTMPAGLFLLTVGQLAQAALSARFG